ncbi:MAG: hypothetical protein LBT62_00065 [Deltaproteobacteria bacterium]|jgi:predicted transposase/invertase (TIGR01784 family)|nr:hypothetical protein [Deltaproteobacteria bacterium]
MHFRPISEVLKERYINYAKEEGRQEGRLKAKREAAKKLLAIKMPVSEIASVTGLTESEILALK